MKACKFLFLLTVLSSSFAFADTIENYIGEGIVSGETISCSLQVYKDAHGEVTKITGETIGQIGATSVGSIFSGDQDSENKYAFSTEQMAEINYKKTVLSKTEGYKFTARQLGAVSAFDEIEVQTQNQVPVKVVSRTNIRALFIKMVNGYGTCENLKLDSSTRQ